MTARVDKRRMRWTTTDDDILELLLKPKNCAGLTVDLIASGAHLSGQGARNRLYFLKAMGYVEVLLARDLPLVRVRLGLARGNTPIWRVQAL